jgi:hypothetical protein
MTVAQLIQSFISEVDRNSPMKSSIHTTQLHLRYRVFSQAFGDEDVSDITQQQIDAWLKPQARSEQRSDLVKLFRFAISIGEITTNPAYSPVQKLPRTGFLTSKVIDA